MENSILHKAITRGHADHGWLKTYHTFSFADYFDPDRINFGALRVLNDDEIDPCMGFGMHPHDNMEIITIPLEGELEHRDSMGNSSVIKQGEIQVMSAGTGIMHSEFNKRPDVPVKLLQIWVYPDKKNVTPRYDQMKLDQKDRHNVFQQILSPFADDAGVWIHQTAWFHLAVFDKEISREYVTKSKENGVYIFVISGKIMAGKEELGPRDGYGVWNTERIMISSSTGAEFLIMDVPMKIKK